MRNSVESVRDTLCVRASYMVVVLPMSRPTHEESSHLLKQAEDVADREGSTT